MLFSRITLCTLLVSAPLLSRAQTTPAPSDPDPAPAPAYRFYVGLGAYNSRHERLGTRFDGGFAWPVQLTLGYQLRPRLALQLGLVSTGTEGSRTGGIPQSDGSVRPYAQTYRDRSTSVSLLGRYTLTRTSTHRLQFDVLGGGTLRHQAYQGRGFYPDPTLPGGFGRFDQQGRVTDVLLTGGASVRYRVTSHLEAVADAMVSAPLSARRAFGTPAGALGLRYRFQLGAR